MSAVKLKTVTLIVALIFMARPGVAHAQKILDNFNDINSIVNIEGVCDIFYIGSNNYDCDSITYLTWRDKKAGYMLPTKSGGRIIITGRRDSQLTPEKYYLYIDRISISFDRNGSYRTYKATGSCESAISTDGNRVFSIKCLISNEAEQVRIEFTGSDKPVAIKHF